MKTLLRIAALICLSQPAWAQDATMTVIQQYLYNESGYAPTATVQPTPQASSEVPYSTAYATSSSSNHQAAVDDESYMDSVHLNAGVRGMNN